MHDHFLKISFCIVLLFSPVLRADTTSFPLYVGVLEYRPSDSPGLAPGSELVLEHRVRLLFHKQGNAWVSMKRYLPSLENYPKNTTWHIAFDGRFLGSFKSKGPEGVSEYANFLERDAFYRPHSEKPLPIIGKPTAEFAGWAGNNYTRPLVVASKKNYKDPQVWKPFKPSQELVNKGIHAFRSRIKSVQICAFEPYRVVTYEYKDEDIQLLKSYRSKSSEYLIPLQINPKLYNCDGPIEEASGWCPQWFYVNKQGDVYALPGDPIKLVDAGDYDDDGVSEVLFWHVGYNEDGYIMYYDNFTQSVEFQWSYH